MYFNADLAIPIVGGFAFIVIFGAYLLWRDPGE